MILPAAPAAPADDAGAAPGGAATRAVPAATSAEPGPPGVARRPRVDLLCRVIDNFGDAGICWRLARQLSDEMNLRVDLWIDLPSILDPWRASAPAIAVHDSASLADRAPEGDILIAALGAELPDALRRHVGRTALPWLRYEYLTAEPWVDGCHGLPSIKPGDTATEWFFYPGFTEATGGLLRERDLFTEQAAFHGAQASRWRESNGLAGRAGALRACLFGYAGPALASLIDGFGRLETPVDVFIASSLFEALGRPRPAGRMRIHPHGWLAQDDFDRLLWSCDLNLVRGEESWVRAQWAGRPFIWQPYQQDDGAHRVKLAAFLERLLEGAAAAPAQSIRTMMDAMSGGDDPERALEAFVRNRAALAPVYTRWRARLAGQTTLMNRLRDFMRDPLQLPV